MVILLVVVLHMMGMEQLVVVLQEGGMDLITASCTEIREDVMSAATWLRLPPSPPPTSTKGAQYMAGISTYLLPRKRKCDGLSMSVRTRLVA